MKTPSWSASENGVRILNGFEILMKQSLINEIKFNMDKCKMLLSGQTEWTHKYELWNNWLDSAAEGKESGSAEPKIWVHVTQWQNKSDSWQWRGIIKNKDYSFYSTCVGLLLCCAWYTLRQIRRVIKDRKNTDQRFANLWTNVKGL